MVTTRKRKKFKIIVLADDEVKNTTKWPMHTFYETFIRTIGYSRWTVYHEKLLMAIPELKDIFHFQQKERFYDKVEKDKNEIFVPEEVVINYKSRSVCWIHVPSLIMVFTKKWTRGCCSKFHHYQAEPCRHRLAYCLTHGKGTNIISLLKEQFRGFPKWHHISSDFVQRWDD